MKRCLGETLAALGTAIALQIASGISADDANILGSLFNVIGDQLTLIAATMSSGDSGNNNSSKDNEKDSSNDNSKDNNKDNKDNTKDSDNKQSKDSTKDNKKEDSPKKDSKKAVNTR